MKITEISAKRPVTTFMFFIAIVLLGFVSLKELSVDLLPDISYPRLSVVTQYAGVAPEEIETLITEPLEAAVSRIPGMRRVESISKEGVSYMTLEFAWGTDMDFAMLHTREKLDSVQLLDDVEDPTIIPLDPQSKPIMIMSISGSRSLLELKEFSEELVKPRLEQIEGIGSAEIAGGVEREIHIEVDPQYMSLYGLTIEQISQRIDAFNRNLQGGTIRKGRFKYALRVVGEFEAVNEIGEISLKTTAERGVVRLKDVAEIKDSIKEREVKVTQAAKEVLEEIKAENPETNILIVSEQAKYINNAISSVLTAIILGGILAFMILTIFLQDFKTPLIIASVIPISIIATFNLLYFRDITLNIMSLGGLALGVGMLVDNSIVVSESVFRHKGLGKSFLDAAVTGTREVGMAVTASTFTTISVFLPVIYVHGVAGQLFKDQALTVTFALLSSLIVSLTLLPMLASRKFDIKIKKAEKPFREIEASKGIKARKKSIAGILLFPFRGIRWLLYNIPKGIYLALNFIFSFFAQLFLLLFHYISLPFKPVIKVVFEAHNRLYNRFSLRYHQALIWCLDNKGKVLSGSVLFLALTIFVATFIPRELMPKPEVSAFDVNIKTPVDYSLEQTSDIVFTLENWLSLQNSVKDSFSQIGIVSGMEGLNPDISLNSAKLYVEAKESSEVEGLIKGLRERLQRFPGLTYSIVREQSTLSQFMAFSTAEIGLKIKGNELNRLNILAEQLKEKLRDIDELADIGSNTGEGKPEFRVKIKKEALEKYNISPAAISDFLVDAVRGKIATQFKELEKKYDVLVRLEENTRENIESLLNEQMPHGETLIPLRELISYEIVRGPKEIRRESQQREVLVTANLKGVKISQVAPEIREKIAGLYSAVNKRKWRSPSAVFYLHFRLQYCWYI